MARRRITDALVRRAKHSGAGRYTDHSDSEIRGFYFRVASTGARTWFVRHRKSGKRQFFGSWPEMSADEARERAIELRRGAPVRKTIANLVAHYRKHHRAPSGRFVANDPNVRLYLDLILEELGHLELEAVRPDHVRTLLLRREDAPCAQNALQKRVSALYNYAAKEGWYQGISPAKAITKNPQHARNRRVTLEERERMLEELRSSSPAHAWGPVFIAATYGCRIGEARMIRWSDIDRSAGTLRIPPNKLSPERTVPLLPLAIEALEAQLFRGNSDAYVFSALDNKPVSSTCVNRFWARARKAQGIEDIVIHDLRHERYTHWVTSGISPKVASAIVGHRDVMTGMRIYHDVAQGDVSAALQRG